MRRRAEVLNGLGAERARVSPKVSRILARVKRATGGRTRACRWRDRRLKRFREIARSGLNSVVFRRSATSPPDSLQDGLRPAVGWLGRRAIQTFLDVLSRLGGFCCHPLTIL